MSARSATGVSGGASPGWRSGLPWAVCLVVLMLIPFFVTSRAAFVIMNTIAIYMVFALSYNILLGQAGMLSFGSAVFYGVGGYAAIHAMNAIGLASEAGSGFWAFFPVYFMPLVGFLAGAVVAFVIGWPCVKKGGVAFAMITLGVGELIATGSRMLPSISGGETGVSTDRVVGPVWFGYELLTPEDVYWFMVAWLMVAALAMWAFTRTPLGRMSNAVRDNHERLRFIGYPPQTLRFMIFIVSGGFGGLAGGMAAVNYEIMTPDTMGLVTSGTILLVTAIGGGSTFYGPMLGAVLFVFMNSVLIEYTRASVFYLGLLFLLVIMFAPKGLAGGVEGMRDAWRSAALGSRIPGWLGSAGATALFIAGAILLVELTYELRSGPGELLGMLGMHFEPTAPQGWILGLALVSLGYAVRRVTRTLREAS